MTKSEGKIVELWEEIKERINGTKITAEEKDLENPMFKKSKVRTLNFPAGREIKRFIIFRTIDVAEELLSIPFEKFVYLNNYAAICSYELDIIEACITTANGNHSDFLYRVLFKGNLPNEDEEVDEDRLTIQLDGVINNQSVKIRIGYPSAEGQVLLTTRGRTKSYPTIRIEGLKPKNHDHALYLLEKISDSIFFEIDIKTGLPVVLEKEKARVIRNRRNKDEKNLELTFPITEFEKNPMYLYWYARGAKELPLLEFLAHYQTIEYYFPHYLEHAAKSAVSNVLKNPKFDIHSEYDLLKLVNTVKAYSGKGNYDERNQLVSTLREVVNVPELKEYIYNNEELKDYYSKKDYKVISTIKINVEGDDPTLVEEVAKRLYDIRCKIVHTKASYDNGSIELILPFSKEAEKLKYDIEIIRFISKQVIIAGGKRLTI